MESENHTPNSFQCPNIYVDEIEYFLTSDEFKILIFICRRILGFQKSRKIKRNKISLSQICKKIISKKDGDKVLSHGVGISRATVIKCLVELEKFKLIFKIGESDKKGQEYELNLGQIEPIDFEALETRKYKRYSADLERTKSARVKLGVPQLSLVSLTNQNTEVSGLSDLPSLVSGTNQKPHFPVSRTNRILVSGTDTLNTEGNTDIETNKRNKQTAPKDGASKPALSGKIKYAEFVSMTEAEYKKLLEKYGDEFTKRLIEKLDNWKGVAPKKRKYESDYRAILTWVVDAVNEKLSKEKIRNGQVQRNASTQRSFGNGNAGHGESKGRIFQPGEVGEYGGSGKKDLRKLIEQKRQQSETVS